VRLEDAQRRDLSSKLQVAALICKKKSHQAPSQCYISLLATSNGKTWRKTHWVWYGVIHWRGAIQTMRFLRQRILWFFSLRGSQIIGCADEGSASYIRMNPV